MLSVDPTQVGLAGSVVVVVVVFLKFIGEENKRRDHQQSRMQDQTDRLTKAINANTSVTNETYQFLKNLNGSLRTAVQDHKKEK